VRHLRECIFVPALLALFTERENERRKEKKREREKKRKREKKRERKRACNDFSLFCADVDGLPCKFGRLGFIISKTELPDELLMSL
jgi:hypothetical protein